MKKFLKIIGILFALLIVIAIATSCGDSDNSSDTIEATPEIANTISKDTFKTMTESVISKHFENYIIEWDEDVLIVSIWSDGVAEGAVLAKRGDAECAASWNEVTANFEQMCKTTLEGAENNGLDISVEYRVLNDTNTDNILLAVYNGIVIYDAVEE